MKRLKDLIKYREVIRNFVSRDLKTRYKGSFLGFFWSFLNPLLNLLVLAVVFSFIIRANVPNYPIFLLVGILAWQFLASSLLLGSRSIIENGGLIKKIFLAREVFPFSVVFSNLVHLLFALVVLVVFLIYFRILPDFSWLLFPYFLFLQSIFLLGLVLIVSSLSVYFRDIPILIESLIPVWYFLSPIFYPPSLIPVAIQPYYNLNPMAAFITAYRNVLLDKTFPDFQVLLVTLISSLLLFVIGYFVFVKLEKGFAEEI